MIRWVQTRMKGQNYIAWTAVMLCLGVGVPTPAQEEDEAVTANETEAVAPAEGASEEAGGEKDPSMKMVQDIAKMRAEIEEIVKEFREIKEPTKSKVSHFERSKEVAEENFKNAEKYIESIRSLNETLTELTSKEYALQRISHEQLDVFLAEADAALNDALRAMGKKSDEIKLTGLELFEKAADKYRGSGMFGYALRKYRSIVTKFEKEWSRTKGVLERNRLKLLDSVREKAEASEKIQLAKLEQRMKSADKDFNKDWFIPRPNSNLLMLEQACEHAKKALAALERVEGDEGMGQLPQLLEDYWNTINRGINLMRSGEFESAESLLKDAEVFQNISHLSEPCLSMEMRRMLSEQVRDLNSEIRNRRNEVRRSKQRIERDETNVQRALDVAASAIERMRDDVADMQEDAKRREEEEARRREEEEERAALEEEEEEEEEVKPGDQERSNGKGKKKTPSRKSKKAEEK